MIPDHAVLNPLRDHTKDRVSRGVSDSFLYPKITLSRYKNSSVTVNIVIAYTVVACAIESAVRFNKATWGTLAMFTFSLSKVTNVHLKLLSSSTNNAQISI